MSEPEIPEGTTVLIHIGKCGGRSLKNGIQNARRNRNPHIVHIRKPPLRRDLRYLIVARGPIARLVSAFRWRRTILIERGEQQKRFDGEFEVLQEWAGLNSLAEALYGAGGAPNAAAQDDIKKIHHIREGISYYLTELLNSCDPRQVDAVLMQESLNDDIHRVFGYRNELREHVNPPSAHEAPLSLAATANLRRFFAEDFLALTKLFCWGKIDEDVYRKAMAPLPARPSPASTPVKPAIAEDR